MIIDGFRECIVFRIAPDDSKNQMAELRTSPTFCFKLATGVVTCDAELASGLWTRMLDLPAAEQMRCHIPLYGIHINMENGRFFTAAICWKCNNISISNSGEYEWQKFDGESVAAKRLLNDVKALAESSEAESETKNDARLR